MLQPLDRAVFGPLSHHYNTACALFMTEHPNNTVTKWTWPSLLKEALDLSMTPQNILSGFQATGIYPFKPDSIPDFAFAPSSIFETTLPSSLHPQTSTNQPPASISITEPVPPTESFSSSTLSPASAPDMSASSEDCPQPSTSTSTSQFQTESNAIDTPGNDELSMSLGSMQRLNSSDTEALFVALGLQVDTAPSHETEDVAAARVLGELANGQSTLQSSSVSEEEADWNVDLRPIFLPPPLEKNEKKGKQKNVSVYHRILTSDEIVKEKREKENEKKEKEAEKLRKEQEKAARKENKGKAPLHGKKLIKKVKKNPPNPPKNNLSNPQQDTHPSGECFICLVPEVENDPFQWVFCDHCQRWMHQDCVPVGHVQFMKAAVSFNSKFFYHMCMQTVL